MQNIKFFVLSLILFGLFFSKAVTAQQLELTTSSKVQIDYQPFSGLPTEALLNVKVSLNNTNDLVENDSINSPLPNRFRIRIKPSSQGRLKVSNRSGETLPLTINSAQRGSSIRQIGNQYLEDIALNLNNNQSRFDYAIGLTESQFAQPGIYSLLLEIDIIDLTTDQVVSNNQIIAVEVIVNSNIQANIAGSHSRHNSNSKFATIDFEELESYESGEVFLQVRGNTDAEIILTSENSGQLVNNIQPNSTIDYSILFDGTSANLKSPLQVIRPVAKTLRGSSYSLKVIIGNTEGAYSGQYRDIITIDVNPQ